MLGSQWLRKAFCACAVAGWCLWPAAPAGADIVPVNLTLDTPTQSINTLEVGITLDTPFGQAVDTDMTTASGNVLANLYVDFDPGTHAATVTGLELTGGALAFTDTSFFFDFGQTFLGTATADAENIAATADTPGPPGSVSATDFPTSEHELIFNGGTITLSGTGPVGGAFAGLIFDLSTNPIAMTTDATGTLIVSAPTILDPQATYDVSLTIPVDFLEVILQEASVSVYLGAAGTVQASGQFTRIIPEPATLALVVLGGVVALRRRRG